jgi:hypothetical protein
VPTARGLRTWPLGCANMSHPAAHSSSETTVICRKEFMRSTATAYQKQFDDD